jgi:hypothetical protein
MTERKGECLLINQATGPLFTDICNVHAEKGWQVVLLTGQVMTINQILESSITISKGIRFNGKSIFTRLITWIGFSLQTFFTVLTSKANKVLVVSNPPLAPYFAFVASLLRRKKLDILIYDVYPHALSEVGFLSEDSILFKVWNRINSYVFKRARHVFAISNGMSHVLNDICPNVAIKVVYPWADNNFIRPIPEDKNWFKTKYGLEGKTVILYSGNMGLTHDFDILLKVADDLAELGNSDFVFLFIGEGLRKNEIEKRANRNPNGNIMVLPYQNSKDLPYSLSSADYGVASLGGKMGGVSLPSKTFYYLAAGLGLIAIGTPKSELNMLVKEKGIGISVDGAESDRLLDYLLSDSPKKRELISSKSRDLSYQYTCRLAERFL